MMVELPEIGESQIQNWVGSKAFQRGYRYFEDEAILNPRRRGVSLIAECQGSQTTPYRVEIRLGLDGILQGSCTCPAGDGGHCKHAAALLLTWMNEPDSFLEVPELETMLENRSKEDLIAIIQQMVSRHPDLEQFLELSALSNLAAGEMLQSHLIAQQIRRAFSSAGGENGDNDQIAENLQPILDLGEDLLDREDIYNASTVYETLLDGMLAYEDCIYNDEGGDLGQVLAECEDGIEECLRSTNAAEPRHQEIRRGLLRTLFDLFLWDLQAGGLGYADEVPAVLINDTTPEEKAQVADWIQAELPDGEGWDEDYQRRTLGGLWLGIMGDQIDDETFLRISRQTGRTQDQIDRLLQSGRVDEALVTARKISGYTITTVADLFEEHGHPDLAMQLIKEQPNSDTDIQLLEWQKQHALAHNQPEEALHLAESLFWQAQSLENYNALLEAAEVLGTREETRARILARLETAGNFSLLVEIYLLENEIDLALAALERVNPDIWWGRMSVLRRQVAQTFEIPRPHEAIRQYTLLIEELIEQRSRGSYAEAARLLQQVHKLYRGLGEDNRWDQLIRRMREEYHRLPAFMDELRRIGI